MKYAVVYMTPNQKKLVMEQAVFYNLDDASQWEQHINKTQHFKTQIIPVFES